MPRKPVHRELPTLAAMHPHFRGFPRDQIARRCLVAALRDTIPRVRREEPVTFYSQQQLADFFGVPQRTVHLACKQLVQEGLLSCRRGAATVVLGHKLQPATPPLGVVGLPIWTQGFVLLSYWRTFLIRLEEELRRHEFVADPVHYQKAEALDPDLAERLLAHHLDYLVWLYPLTATRPILARLADGGVRTITIAQSPGLIPQVTEYVTAWERAYIEALTAWRKAGVTEVMVIADPVTLGQTGDPARRALARVGLPHRLQAGDNLDRLRLGKHVGVVFPDDLAQVAVARRNPQALVRLLQRARVLVANSIPVEEIPPEVRVDVVRINWEKLARRVAADIATQSRGSTPRNRTIQAEWFNRVPAARFADRY